MVSQQPDETQPRGDLPGGMGRALDDAGPDSFADIGTGGAKGVGPISAGVAIRLVDQGQR